MRGAFDRNLVQRWKTHLRHVTNVESETFEPLFLHGAHNEYLSSIRQTCLKNSSDVGVGTIACIPRNTMIELLQPSIFSLILISDSFPRKRFLE